MTPNFQSGHPEEGPSTELKSIPSGSPATIHPAELLEVNLSTVGKEEESCSTSPGSRQTAWSLVLLPNAHPHPHPSWFLPGSKVPPIQTLLDWTNSPKSVGGKKGG